MSNTLFHETRLTLAQAAQRLNLSVTTLWRWCQRGVKGTRLESFVLGHVRYTSVESLERFAVACTARQNGTAATSMRTTAQRERDAKQAEKNLAEAGL